MRGDVPAEEAVEDRSAWEEVRFGLGIGGRGKEKAGVGKRRGKGRTRGNIPNPIFFPGSGSAWRGL